MLNFKKSQGFLVKTNMILISFSRSILHVLVPVEKIIRLALLLMRSFADHCLSALKTLSGPALCLLVDGTNTPSGSEVKLIFFMLSK